MVLTPLSINHLIGPFQITLDEAILPGNEGKIVAWVEEE